MMGFQDDLGIGRRGWRRRSWWRGEKGDHTQVLGLPYQVPQTEQLKTTETFSGSLEAESKIKMRAGLP